ncbi:hypothetical protein L6164_037699 [Bauhinia variegata]|uniref:Uncharacterized protein n=1 Tax=Bauhinia variegata TaxID=167791 RepID=A0ACB9KKV1_BAUVA|nr:hypothetical protein L6164_037699 [Bauhinia variegata]
MAETHTGPAPTPTLSPRPCDHANNVEEAHGFSLMVLLLAIVCAFLCALGLNTMLQCVFQCANRVLTEPLQWIASRRLNSGLKKKEMVALPTSTYYSTHSPSSASASASTSAASASNCAICLAEFCDGDMIRFLPKCNHTFHVACIDTWLLSHSSCPTCRHHLKSINHSLHSCLHIVIPNN